MTWAQGGGRGRGRGGGHRLPSAGGAGRGTEPGPGRQRPPSSDTSALELKVPPWVWMFPAHRRPDAPLSEGNLTAAASGREGPGPGVSLLSARRWAGPGCEQASAVGMASGVEGLVPGAQRSGSRPVRPCQASFPSPGTRPGRAREPSPQPLQLQPLSSSLRCPPITLLAASAKF